MIDPAVSEITPDEYHRVNTLYQVEQRLLDIAVEQAALEVERLKLNGRRVQLSHTPLF